MVKQYIIHLMNMAEVIERKINTTSIEAALYIAQALYPNHRVVNIESEVK